MLLHVGFFLFLKLSIKKHGEVAQIGLPPEIGPNQIYDQPRGNEVKAIFTRWIQIGGKFSTQPAYSITGVDLEEVGVGQWNGYALKDLPPDGLGQVFVEARNYDISFVLKFFEVAFIEVRARPVWQKGVCVVKPLRKVVDGLYDLHLRNAELRDSRTSSKFV